MIIVSPSLQGALNMNKDMILKGDNKQDARFGFSIAAVGDLNQDDFQGTLHLENCVFVICNYRGIKKVF